MVHTQRARARATHAAAAVAHPFACDHLNPFPPQLLSAPAGVIGVDINIRVNLPRYSGRQEMGDGAKAMPWNYDKCVCSTWLTYAMYALGWGQKLKVPRLLV